MILPLLFQPVILGFRGYPGWNEYRQVRGVTSQFTVFHLTGENEGDKGDDKIYFGECSDHIGQQIHRREIKKTRFATGFF